jgi:hypothetical protein
MSYIYMPTKMIRDLANPRKTKRIPSEPLRTSG